LDSDNKFENFHGLPFCCYLTTDKLDACVIMTSGDSQGDHVRSR
jgi:hypothetical protein